MTLTGTQLRDLSAALRKAFNYNRLEELLRYGLNKNLEDISLGEDMPAVVFDLLRTAEAENWTMKLLAQARQANPSNVELQNVARQFGLAPALPTETAFEVMVSKSKFADVQMWGKQLSEMERRICRIEIRLSNNNIVYGTGFLVGNDRLLTNYHVMRSVIERDFLKAAGRPWAEPMDVKCRFDFMKTSDGTVIQEGIPYSLALDWLIDSSPMSPYDHEIEPKSGQPAADHLDFALIKLAPKDGKTAGGSPISPLLSAPERSWVDLDNVAEIQPGESLVILQHPKADPQKIAFGTVLSINTISTRFTYNTNTEPGSSGSPCFNSEWQLVGIHHMGDPDFSPEHKPLYNQGIPLTAITKLLRARGKL